MTGKRSGIIAKFTPVFLDGRRTGERTGERTGKRSGIIAKFMPVSSDASAVSMLLAFENYSMTQHPYIQHIQKIKRSKAWLGYPKHQNQTIQR